MKHLKTIILPVLLFTVLSCNRDYDPPELKAIQNITLKNLNEGIAELSADALFHNPNKVKVRLREVNIKIYIDDRQAATIDEKMKVIIPPRSDFNVPVNASVSLKELGLVNTLLSVFGGKKMQVSYVGYMKLTYHGVSFKVPVNHQEEIRIRL